MSYTCSSYRYMLIRDQTGFLMIYEKYPLIESLNGWMKEELAVDFGLADTEDVLALLDRYVHYFNNERLSSALGYKSPVQYKTELGFP